MAEVSGERGKRRPRARARPDESPETPDAIEIALQAVASGADAHPLARAVLEKHASLLEIQCQREREQWSVLRLQRWTRWLILGAVLGLLAGFAALLWSASRTNSLVIEPFEVPPELARQGLTGKVVSARLLDALAAMQRKTESMRGAKSYANDWQDDIKLDIPSTGVSIDEAWRTIKGWMGEETRIGGEIVNVPAGIAITSRAGAESGGTVTGAAGDFDTLIQQAARGIFKVTQPYRYAIGLRERDPAEAIRLFTELTASPSDLERKWAYSGLSATYRTQGDYVRAAAAAKAALAIDPNLLPAIGNLSLAEQNLGHDQAVVDLTRRLDAAARGGLTDEYDSRIAMLNQLSQQGENAKIRQDPIALRALAARFEGMAGGSSFASQSTRLRLEAALAGRDVALAMRLPLFVVLDSEDALARRALGARLALERGRVLRDPGAVWRAAGELRAIAEGLPANAARAVQIEFWPEDAIALAQVGLPLAAQAFAAPLPRDCYQCVRARGWAALARGDRTGARRWFAEAVRQGPGVPAARVDLGRLLALDGRTEAALAQFREAARASPNAPDPARYEGDVLARAGRLAEAAKAYARAVRVAPNWGTLRLQQGRVLAALGDADGARTAFVAAGATLLAPADRDRLARARAALH